MHAGSAATAKAPLEDAWRSKWDSSAFFQKHRVFFTVSFPSPLPLPILFFIAVRTWLELLQIGLAGLVPLGNRSAKPQMVEFGRC